MSEYEVINGIRTLPRDVPLNTLLALGGVGEGRTYYVNNISGSSGNTGLSWDAAMDEVSTAITASETYRALYTGSTNDYRQNTIIIQGTGTAYAQCTTFPHYTNVIGLGATAKGYGEGVARIGLDIHTVGTYGGGIYAPNTTAGDCRGSNFYNVEFQASHQRSAIRGRYFLKSTFEDCAFMASGNPIGPPDCGFEMLSKASGLRIINCLFGTHSGINSEPYYGLKIMGTLFNNCEVRGCHITGSLAGVYVNSTMNLGWCSVVRDCFIGEGSRECAIGIDDNAGTGTIHYINCFINAADPIDPGDDDTRFVGCVAQVAFVKT